MAFTRSGVRSSLAPPFHFYREFADFSHGYAFFTDTLFYGYTMPELSIPDSWQLIEDNGQSFLKREFTFSNFVEAFGFMSSVALLAEKADHHIRTIYMYIAHPM